MVDGILFASRQGCFRVELDSTFPRQMKTAGLGQEGKSVDGN